MTINKILIVGAGGREHAIGKALANSNHNVSIFAVGEWINPGLDEIGTMDVLDISKPSTIVEYAQIREIDTVIVGSENQLAQGLADSLETAGIFCIGPTHDLARIETDKIYARRVIDHRYNPRYCVFDRRGYSREYLKDYLLNELNGDYVIKAVGLRGGKGVKVSDVHLHSFAEATEWCEQLLATDGIFLVEERLFGEEFTLMAFADGETLVHMPVVKDFKRRDNDDRGPNTGGMGCISYPNSGAPFLSSSDLKTARKINAQVYSELPGYKGILYGSFMKTNDGVKVIEYNSRFGDPEAINVLMLLKTDFVDVLDAIKEQRLKELNVVWSKKAMVTNYIVAPGYPESPIKTPIQLPEITNIIYAKIERQGEEYLQLASRSAAVWSQAADLKAAYKKNQLLLSLIHGPCHYRTDLGK